MNQKALKQRSIISTEIINHNNSNCSELGIASVQVYGSIKTQYPRYSNPVDVTVFNVKGVGCHCVEKMASKSHLLSCVPIWTCFSGT